MPDLNEAVLPSIWTLARRTLAAAGSMPVDALVDRLTPTGLLKRSGTDSPSSRHVGPSVRALTNLGVLVEMDGELRLADDKWDEGQFRFAVANALLTVPEGEDIWEIREGAGRLEHHLEVSVAWTQLLGARSSVRNWANASELLDTQFGVDRPLLRDTAPYNTLERLVQWLGIAGYSQGALIPDPTPLVRVAVEDLIPGGRCSMREVLAKAAEVFPWLPNGPIGQEVASRMRDFEDDSAQSGRVPEGLSLALIRLQGDGVLRLEEGDDPESRTLLSFAGREVRGIATVVLL